jgi:AbrB family looped-hinge helix DNA binding protein
MAKVTSKLQVTIPKRIADQYGIAPGDEVDFIPAGDAIRLQPATSVSIACLGIAERLRLFDIATSRQREREKAMPPGPPSSSARDWTREELYSRGKPR